MENKLIYLSTSQIMENPLNKWENGVLTDLTDNIRNFGVIEPLAVIGPDTDGKYLLISGERRLRASRIIEADTGEEYRIPAHVVSGADMSEDMQSILIDSANLESREVPIQMRNERRAAIMEHLFSLADKGEIKEKEIAHKAAQYFQLSDVYGRFWRRVFQTGTDSLKDMVTRGELGVKPAASIAQHRPEEQERVVEKLKANNELKRTIGQEGGARKADVSSAVDIIKEIDTLRLQDQKKQMETLGENLPSSQTQDEHTPSDEPPTEELTQAENIPETPVKKKAFDFDDIEIDLDGLDIDALINENEAARFSEEDTVKQQWSEDVYQTKLNTIIHWCREIVKKSEPTEDEWNAIQACCDVANCFM